MKFNKEGIILKLAKDNLSIFDWYMLYRIFLGLPDSDTNYVKLFIENYYDIEGLPDDFYKLFLNYIHNNNFKNLFSILSSKNIYELINFLKFDGKLIVNPEIISPLDYFNISYRHINIIIELLKKRDAINSSISLRKAVVNAPEWMLKKQNFNTIEEYTTIAIKMYYSIGFDNAIDVLNNKYGLIDYEIIHYLFNSLNINKNKNNIHFNNFLFNNKKDPNNIMRLILNGECIELFINFNYFYNSLDYFIDKLGTKLNKNKVTTLLKERYLAKQIDNPQITGDILEDMVSSYYHRYEINESEKEILVENMKVYNLKLKNKITSSIMNMKLPSISDYIFELIPLNDARNLVMGYRSSNCFRINGDAFILFDDFLSNPHMRILSVSTKEYKDFGMILLMRNGNVLIAQGIETSNRVPKEILGEKLYDCSRQILKYIMDKMNDNGDEIVANIIGLSNDNTSNYNHNILPFIINPILNNDRTNFYNGIYNYQGLLDLKENKTIKDIKLYTPNNYYYDNDIVLRRDNRVSRNDIMYREIEKILISLRYAKFMTTSKEIMVDYYNELIGKQELFTICSLQWFITVFDDGSIDTFINSDNPNVIKKYESELSKINDSRVMIKKKNMR